MSLDAKTWTPASIHDVVLAWLQAERNDVAQLDAALDSPNLSDAGENRERLLRSFSRFLQTHNGTALRT
jgi:hypothetical protein